MAGISTVIERNEVYELRAPARQTLAGVFASPHSGTDYRPEFLTQSRLDPITLRRSEDAFVDEIFAAAPERGAPLLKALFPRAFIDPNREPWELDAAMFAEPLPNYVNSRSPRVAAGLGDCHGVSCGAALVETVEAYIAGLGYVVTRNIPYAGGYVTRTYGRPERGVHALQIEINRALYMDEERVERRPRLERLVVEMDGLIQAIGTLDGTELAA